MKTIRTTDTLFATIIHRGVTIISARISGVASISDIIKTLRQSIGQIAGLVTLRLRNATEGWTADKPLILA
ncbi:MAG: hypothetical protein NC098_02365 [Lachnoclostridium sp.]|nr:hypothetical protein [Lachnoclostridium sp.]